MVYLREVDSNSVEQCSKLKCTNEQCQFTNSPTWTLLQAAYDAVLKDKCKVYAIFNNETVVGMVRLDFTVFDDCYEFTNLIVDAKYQRRQYATSAIKEIIKIFTIDGKHKSIRLHVAKNNTAAILLYEKVGFIHYSATDDDWFYTYYYHIV